MWFFNRAKYRPFDAKLWHSQNPYIAQLKGNNWKPRPSIMDNSSTFASHLPQDYNRNAITFEGQCTDPSSTESEAEILKRIDASLQKAFSLEEQQAVSLRKTLNGGYGQFVSQALIDSIDTCIQTTLGEAFETCPIYARPLKITANLVRDKKSGTYSLNVVLLGIALATSSVEIYPPSPNPDDINFYHKKIQGEISWSFVFTENDFQLVLTQFSNKLLEDLCLTANVPSIKHLQKQALVYKHKTALLKLAAQETVYAESIDTLINTVNKLLSTNQLTLDQAKEIFLITKSVINNPTSENIDAYLKNANTYKGQLNYIHYANTLAATMGTIACTAVLVGCIGAVAASFLVFPPLGIVGAVILSGAIAGSIFSLTGTAWGLKMFGKSLAPFTRREIKQSMSGIVTTIEAVQQQRANRPAAPHSAYDSDLDAVSAADAKVADVDGSHRSVSSKTDVSNVHTLHDSNTSESSAMAAATAVPARHSM